MSSWLASIGIKLRQKNSYISMEIFTKEIANTFRQKALGLSKDQNYTGAFKNLAQELREKCGVTEVEAINILNGVHINDYVHLYAIKNGLIDAPIMHEKRSKKDSHANNEVNAENNNIDNEPTVVYVQMTEDEIMDSGWD